jgi:hypothetical protein
LESYLLITTFSLGSQLIFWLESITDFTGSKYPTGFESSSLTTTGAAGVAETAAEAELSPLAFTAFK